MIEALTMIALSFPVPQNDPELGSRKARIGNIATHVVKHCETYAPRARYPVDACAAVAMNGAFWESSLRYDVHTGERKGPGGEECLFQIHRLSSAVPFDQWRPHPYGTNAGIENTSRCVESGVKIFMYHVWRCGLRLLELHPLALLYSEYHQPGDCKTLSGNSYNRANMALRTLRKLQQAEKKTAASKDRRLNLFPRTTKNGGGGVKADHATTPLLRASEGGALRPVSAL